MLAGEDDPSGRRAQLADATGAEVVVTLGREGALWTDGRRLERCPAAPVDGPPDTTGAGDAFTAGLLAARLAGESPPAALAAAVRLAAEAVGRPGARPGHASP